MPKTALLPPVTAVRMVWALTGKFSDDEHSQNMSLYVEDALKHIQEESQKATTNPTETSYIIAALASMKSSLRSLDTAYKGRALNFEENEKLRSANLESIKESLAFGVSIQDFIKALPSMTIGAVGGTTVINALVDLSDFELWGLGMVLAAIGYLVNLLFARNARNQRQMLYVTQDYERGLYYDQYVNRVTLIMQGLLNDLEGIHKRTFDEFYDGGDMPSITNETIKSILVGVHSTFCKYVHEHMRQKKVTPELWTRCESGTKDVTQSCPHWEGSREKTKS